MKAVGIAPEFCFSIEVPVSSHALFTGRYEEYEPPFCLAFSILLFYTQHFSLAYV